MIAANHGHGNLGNGMPGRAMPTDGVLNNRSISEILYRTEISGGEEKWPPEKISSRR
jgi:hypothetical protein